MKEGNSLAAKESFNAKVECGLMERLRNAIWHIGRGLTLSKVLHWALKKQLEELEAQNGGKPFPQRESEIPKSPRRPPQPHKAEPAMTVEQILAWADAYHRRTGQWPTKMSGPVVGAPGTTWLAVDTALRKGEGGLPGASSLRRLLNLHRPRKGRTRADK
jgi:hypothetical protein